MPMHTMAPTTYHASMNIMPENNTLYDANYFRGNTDYDSSQIDPVAND